MPYERRHFIRVLFEAPAQLAMPSGTRRTQVLDLSLKGALVVLPTLAPLEPGALCRLTVPLTGTGTHIAMSVQVAYVEGRHAGLLCRGIDLDSVTHLRRLIELQLGDPALLERDLAELGAPGAALAR
ncbi:pilus assembly protein PilZ [Acidovorax sp. SRB_14]|uniref:PilZ domain-containing protein n=1 Tax=unclassified Acidovorax TaxID=2684926 RepID=UPI00145CCEB8|nr:MULTISPECIES: PilZ domain-containing protein [unclassified Acidovorax]NMM75253.1 pilus assembly protein PilZ [Acidovorax sp. SRB_24]NMM80760.1 pilus assembly protein PilZ [Acidovorax sp. SRB_14]NMM85731.1 pilus assembly protein PilZ [Rhodococcus sp. SRB_17]